jgi:plastocyanin
VLLLCGAFAGCGGTSEQTVPDKKPPAVADTETPAVVKEIIIDNFTYEPPELKIAPGTRVTWINRDDVPHTVTSKVKPRSFDSGALDTDERFSHVFTNKGTYEYFCAVHPKMIARIVVE